MSITGMDHYLLPDNTSFSKIGLLVFLAAILIWIAWYFLKKKTNPKKKN